MSILRQQYLYGFNALVWKYNTELTITLRFARIAIETGVAVKMVDPSLITYNKSNRIPWSGRLLFYVIYVC